jgi:hypothetical protein
MNGFPTTAPTSLQYLLLFRHGPSIAELTREQRKQILSQWMAWTESLFAQKKMLSANPLAEAGKVITQKKKEVVGGYFLLEVADEAEALEIASQCPGLPYGFRVEMRPVVPSCHIFADVGLETMSVAG